MTIFCVLHYIEASDQLHTLDALPQEKEPNVPIGQEESWAAEPVWMMCNRETFLARARSRTTAIHLVTTPTELRLLVHFL